MLLFGAAVVILVGCIGRVWRDFPRFSGNVLREVNNKSVYTKCHENEKGFTIEREGEVLAS